MPSKRYWICNENLEATVERIDSNVEGVREMLKRRAEIGLTKYGVTTERTDIDLIAWVNHALEETCDLAVYLYRIKSELLAWKYENQQ